MSTRRPAVAVVAALLVAPACAPTTAVVNGQTVPRPSYDFTGQPFTVHHKLAHPQPGSPSHGVRDAGGHIIGNVCGIEIDYDVEHRGDHVALEGFLDSALPSQVEVRDEKGARLFHGNLGSFAGGAVVDLALGPSRLTGRVGFREFVLEQQGDDLVGVLRIGSNLASQTIVHGRDALWALPPADQAAILPALLTCFGGRIERDGRNPLVVGFGGKPQREAAESSSVYVTSDGQAISAGPGTHSLSRAPR